jgi:hypothetical protein
LGNIRAILGELSNGDHGIELFDLQAKRKSFCRVGTTMLAPLPKDICVSGGPNRIIVPHINLGASGDAEITTGAFDGCAGNGTPMRISSSTVASPGSIFGLASTAASAGNAQSTRRISSSLGTTLTPKVGPLIHHGLRVHQWHGQLLGKLSQGAAALTHT